MSGSATRKLAAHSLPWGALLALSAAGFLAIFTETIPAGLLPQIAEGLGVSESAAGQLVTLYALGSVAAAIPLISATRQLNRKHVLLAGVLGLMVFNTITAVAPWYPLILLARFIAGAAAALVWGVLSGYARRLVTPALQGRALTIAGIGQPLALAVGVPLGAWAGSVIEWRWVFMAISLAALVLGLWISAVVPGAPGQSAATRTSLGQVIAMPGIRTVLLVALLWVLSHNILYTYFAPLLGPRELQLDAGLMLFGVASFLGISAIGFVIDRALRAATLGALLLLTLATFAISLPSAGFFVIAAAVVVWGFSFGGAPVLLQTALADRAGRETDAAQSVFVMFFNLAVAGGGLVGGLILGVGAPAPWLAWTAGGIALLTLLLVLVRRRAFPPGKR